MMCGTRSVPARAVPETSWQRGRYVPCAAPRYTPLLQPGFERSASQRFQQRMITGIHNLCFKLAHDCKCAVLAYAMQVLP